MIDDQEAFDHLRDLKSTTLGSLPSMVIGQFRSREVRLPLSPVATFVYDYRNEVFPDKNHWHKEE